ncbi:MAG TPA: outer membrane lipid asymmetry maintenance protein MlaD [Rhizomicrobium sp.]|jgi:phospholipid/cholesterol/gamma-HCH transport system substrate-binding protein|nr:outer membrane lipid asymmetry maintenance protein MlaD [Rhizomicrobium sp.]
MDAGIARMRENNVAETIIGAVVVAVAVLFVIFAYMRTGSGSLSGYEIQARLPRVDGIGIGTDVRLSGIKIGSISDLTLDPKNYLVTVHMNIRDDIKIPVDSSLMVTSSGLLGSSYISLTPGGDDKMLAPGGMIQNSQGSVDLMGLVGRFIGSGGNNNQGQAKPPQQPQPQQPKPQSLPPGP